MSPTSLPRPAVETLVLAGAQPRRRRILRQGSQPASPAPTGGPAQARIRRAPARRAGEHALAVFRPARRSTPVQPLLPDRRTGAAPGGSLRLVHAARPAGEARRPARRSPELLWSNHRAAPSPLVMETAAPPPAAAAEPVRNFPLPAPPPGFMPQPAAPDMNRLVDEVLYRLDRQARHERLRRGI